MSSLAVAFALAAGTLTSLYTQPQANAAPLPDETLTSITFHDKEGNEYPDGTTLTSSSYMQVRMSFAFPDDAQPGDTLRVYVDPAPQGIPVQKVNLTDPNNGDTVIAVLERPDWGREHVITLAETADGLVNRTADVVLTTLGAFGCTDNTNFHPPLVVSVTNETGVANRYPTRMSYEVSHSQCSSSEYVPEGNVPVQLAKLSCEQDTTVFYREELTNAPQTNGILIGGAITSRSYRG